MRQYPEYKASGVEWLGDIPKGWDATLLKKSLTNIKDGTHGSFQRQTEGKPLLSAKNVQINKIDISETESVISEADYNSIVKIGYPKRNDLLLTIVGTIGRAYVYDLDYPLAFQRSVAFLRFNKSNFVKFFYYQVQSNLFVAQLISLSKTSAQSGVYLSDIKNSIALIPPLPEQQTIVNFLDYKTGLIDNFIANRQQQQKLLKEQKAGIINKAVTKGINPHANMKPSGIEWIGDIPEDWQVSRIKFLAKINPQKGQSNFSKLSNDFCVFLPMENVNEDGSFTNNTKMKISEVWNGFTYFERNDVLVAKITPCFENGKGAYLYNLETEIGFGSTEFHVLRANKDKILPEIIFYLIRSDLFMTIGKAFMRGSAGQQRVPTDFISNFFVPFADIVGQKSILDYIKTETAKIDTIITKYQKQIELMQEYRTALISQAVTGKIDVRD